MALGLVCQLQGGLLTRLTVVWNNHVTVASLWTLACLRTTDRPKPPEEQAQCLHWARSETPKELHTRDHHQSAKTQEWRTRALQWWEALCAPQIRLVLLALRDWTFPFPFSDLLLDETTLGAVVLAPFMFHAIFLPLLGWLPIITWLFLVAVQTLHFGSSTN